MLEKDLTGPRIDRRTVIGTIAVGTAALAGCLGDDDAGDDGDDPSDDSANGDDPSDDDSANGDDAPAEPLDEPAEFPEGEACTVCNMITEEYPEWNAQLVKTDETRVFFCSAGCLLAYFVDPEQFGGETEEVEHVWVTDYGTGELIDGMESYYVRVEDPDHVDDIMMMNPTPFAERERAEAFVDELNEEHGADYDHDEDIITFDAFDEELAMLYRADFLDGDDHSHDDHDH